MTELGLKFFEPLSMIFEPFSFLAFQPLNPLKRWNGRTELLSLLSRAAALLNL